MSWDRRGNQRRRNYRDDYHRQPLPVSPTEKIRGGLLKFGDVDAEQELANLGRTVSELKPPNPTLIAESIRIGVTEQPYKIPHYATLLVSLCHSSSMDVQNILEELFKGFQGYLDKQSWRDTRLCVQLYAHLTSAGLVSLSSFTSLLSSFTSVLDEFGVSVGRAREAACCAGEGVMIARTTLSSSTTADVISSIRTYSETLSRSKMYTRPLTTLASVESSPSCCIECLDALLMSLSSSEGDSEPFPRPYATIPALPPSFTPYNLPPTLVPPDPMDLIDDPQQKHNDWPEWSLILYPPEITPPWYTTPGYLLRSWIIDVIHIFEVNRKECARILLELPKWTVPGTFRDQTEGSQGWQIESTVIEAILSMAFTLPSPARRLRLIYYTALVAEVCKLRAGTVGPAVGRAVRRLYELLSCTEGALDVELSHRFAEWFAVHMSNFGFGWVWKEWVPDLELSVEHPKQQFMKQAIELEIRLAYPERIRKSLPDPIGDAMMHEDMGTPRSEFEDPSNAYHESFNTILTMLKSRTASENLLSTFEGMKADLSDVNGERMLRKVVAHCILTVGARSFSHFLAVVERYLSLLKTVVGGSGTEGKRELLASVVEFWWNAKAQMVGIVFDKLVQYQVVECLDIVACVFASDGWPKDAGFGASKWELVEGALDKAVGRVASATTKLEGLKREEEERTAVGGMPIDGEPEAVANAARLLQLLKKEQRDALVAAVEGFIKALPKFPESLNWEDRVDWSDDEWREWTLFGWWRAFCRSYATHLNAYQNTIHPVFVAGSVVETGIWEVITGQQ